MATVQVANTSKRLVSITLSRSGVVTRLRLNPGVTPVEKAEWDEAAKLDFTKRYMDEGIISTNEAIVKKSKTVNKEAAASAAE